MKTLTAASVVLLTAASLASPSLAQTPSRSRPADANTAAPPPPSAGDRGTVISVTPIVQQVQVPRQVCQDEAVMVQQQPSGGGALFGAIVGGVLGNTISSGSGRAAATAFGVLGGAAVGNSVEASNQPSYAQTVRRCTNETAYEDRTVSYSVVYEYGGRQYTTVMRRDPGRYVQVQVQATPDDDGAAPRPRSSAPPVSSRPQPVYVDRGDYPRYAEPVYVPYPPPAPVYYYDYGPPPYAAPFGTGLVVGTLIGYGLHHGYRGHGRYWRR